MNSFNVVGRVVEKPEEFTTQGGTKYLKVLLEVPKGYKETSDKEVYEVSLWGSLAEEVIEKGILLGIKGHMSANNYEKEDKTRYYCQLVGEKVSYYE